MPRPAQERSPVHCVFVCHNGSAQHVMCLQTCHFAATRETPRGLGRVLVSGVMQEHVCVLEPLCHLFSTEHSDFVCRVGFPGAEDKETGLWEKAACAP